MFHKRSQAAANLNQTEGGMPSGFREEFKRSEETAARRPGRSRRAVVPSVESLEGRQLLRG
jgi:hypothetical protein